MFSLIIDTISKKRLNKRQKAYEETTFGKTVEYTNIQSKFSSPTESVKKRSERKLTKENHDKALMILNSKFQGELI